MAILKVKKKEKLADIETPVSAYLKLCRGERDSFLLESVETKDITGRYSIVAYDPLFFMELDEDKVFSSGRDIENERKSEQPGLRSRSRHAVGGIAHGFYRV